jgi:hypothetical protein
MIVYELLTQSAFLTLSIVTYFLNNTMFQEPVMLPSSSNEAPNLMGLLDRAIVGHKE